MRKTLQTGMQNGPFWVCGPLRKSPRRILLEATAVVSEHGVSDDDWPSTVFNGLIAHGGSVRSSRPQ